MRNVSQAHSELKKIREKERERRLEDIYDYLEAHPGQTAYSLSKVKRLKLNKGTARSDLCELEDRGDIKLVEERLQGRIRRKAFIKELSDHYFVKFHEINLKIPAVRKSAQKSLDAGYEVTVVREDKTELKVLPNEDLDKKLAPK